MSNSSSRSWTNIAGSLFVEQSGVRSTTSQVLLHGFTQTSRSWNRYLDFIDPQQSIIRVDAPGHGGSSTVAADLTTTAQMVVERCGFGDYIGYSMGARLALHIALLHPESVRRLVLISGSPGLRTVDERHARSNSDELLAQEIAEVGVERFVDKWLSTPLFSGLTSTREEIQDRLRNTAEGLASSLRLSGTGKQESLWDKLQNLEMPVLLVVGINDEKFCQIGKEMKSAMGTNANLIVVENAGHSVHLEQTREFHSVIEEFLK
jgi:2-succinyl-6-hydroxy-2,4-cyclohexadiene-1-carboxylate synthase